MKTKEPKSVGEWFELLPSAEDRSRLLEIAKISLFAENAIWMEWRLADPLSPIEARQFKADYAAYMRAKSAHDAWVKKKKDTKDKTEKKQLGPEPEVPEKPTTPNLDLKTARNGLSWTKFAGSLCPGLKSYVYDAIVNRVGTLYRKASKRLAFLTFDERLPTSKQLRIQFREKACRIVHHPENPEWFRVQFTLDGGQPLLMDFKCRGKSPFTIDWLNELADSGANPSGGCISSRKKRGKLVWQFSVSRTPREGENEQVKPIEGRRLVCWAPLDQHEFMICEVEPLNGRPWRFNIESADMIFLKRKAEQLRSTMGRNYHQSRDSASHGHGRARAIRGKRPFAGRYERRCKNWIENRSAAVVRFAVQARCQGLWWEDLSKREPRKLALGDFPYYQLGLRVKQKAEASGLTFKLLKNLENLKERLGESS